jgi:hypothetical protein
MTARHRQRGRASRAGAATEQVLQALANLPAKEQLAIVSRPLLALLDSVRPRFAHDPESQRAFDLLCSDTLTSLRQDIEALRFTKAS